MTPSLKKALSKIDGLIQIKVLFGTLRERTEVAELIEIKRLLIEDYQYETTPDCDIYQVPNKDGLTLRAEQTKEDNL